MGNAAIPVILDTQDLQNILKCGRRQAYSLMKHPAFPSITIGAKRIVTLDALNEWLETNQGRSILLN